MSELVILVSIAALVLAVFVPSPSGLLGFTHACVLSAVVMWAVILVVRFHVDTELELFTISIAIAMPLGVALEMYAHVTTLRERS